MPDITLIELNPLGAAIARAQRLSPELLPLTCPDPGPRPHGFLRNGALVTATSGTPLKFDGDYAYTYPEAIALILKTTGGRHIHIGPLNDELTGGIDQALRREGIDPRGFVHRPWVPSVAKALWDCDCDVYVASFPTDGARALVEVAASGTPYLAHTRRPHRNPENDPMTGAGTGWWRNWDELEARLGELSDRRRLETRSEQMRQRYMRFHHPSVFERTLDDILAGKEGLADPQAAGRDRAMLALITAALADDVIEESAVSRAALGAFRRDSDAFRRDIEASATRFRAGEEAARSAVEGNLLKAIGQSDRATSEKVERLAGEQATLAEAHGRLSEAHGRLGEAHRQSREGHGRLSEAHRRLGESHRQLQEAHRRLGESHRQLREAHGKLSEAHTQLIKKHKRFVRRFNRIIRTSREKRRRGILGWFGRGRG